MTTRAEDSGDEWVAPPECDRDGLGGPFASFLRNVFAFFFVPSVFWQERFENWNARAERKGRKPGRRNRKKFPLGD